MSGWCKGCGCDLPDGVYFWCSAACHASEDGYAPIREEDEIDDEDDDAVL